MLAWHLNNNTSYTEAKLQNCASNLGEQVTYNSCTETKPCNSALIEQLLNLGQGNEDTYFVYLVKVSVKSHLQ